VEINPSNLEPVLKLTGITKRFGTLIANDDISLTLKRGEILALLGENGAGKSTLVSILFGHYTADAGGIEVFGQPLAAGNPRAALAAGVGMVHQHFTLADNLSVLDNVLIGREPLWSPRSQRAKLKQQLNETAQRFGLAVDPEAAVASLSVGERQRVEILKALTRGAKILILDEPTAVLTPQESEDLFATLKQMTAQGLSIIFISHKLDEVLRVSQRVIVLRAGKVVAHADTANVNKAQLAQWMVGRDVAMPLRPVNNIDTSGAALFALEHIHTHAHPRLHDVNLQVHAGEIVAIAGVAGNGQAALADTASGVLRPASGNVRVSGQTLGASPAAFIGAGVGRIPEDRGHTGVVGDMTVWENVIAEQLTHAQFSRAGMLRVGVARAYAQTLAATFDVRAQSMDAPARKLSGGNIQKLILGRVLARQPKLIVANQPTWGLDVGAVSFIHTQLIAACERGAGVLLISEDLDEVFVLADRIGVMVAGQLSELKPRNAWTLQTLGLAMAGTEYHALSPRPLPHAGGEADRQRSTHA
jgi:general nucleoside transport system ATP-binding protein